MATLCYVARQDRRDGTVIKVNKEEAEMKNSCVSAGLAASNTDIFTRSTVGILHDCGAISQLNESHSFFPPAGLAIDYYNQRLYWADPELSHIGSMRLDGSDPLVTISTRHGKHALNVPPQSHRFTIAAHAICHFMSFIVMTYYCRKNTVCFQVFTAVTEV